MEGDLKGSQWTNVQDPVKQMITAITKAVRTQSAGIKVAMLWSCLYFATRLYILSRRSYVATRL